MRRCNRCDYDNANQSTYCNQCGTKLNNDQSDGVSSLAYAPYVNDNMDCLSDHAASSQIDQLQKFVILHPNTRSTFSTILVTIIFCISDFISSLGLMGGLFSIMDSSPAVLIGLILFVASIIVLVITLKKHNAPILRGWLKVLLIFAILGGVIITLFTLSIIFYNNKVLSNIILGTGFLFFGIAIEVIILL